VEAPVEGHPAVHLAELEKRLHSVLMYERLHIRRQEALNYRKEPWNGWMPFLRLETVRLAGNMEGEGRRLEFPKIASYLQGRFSLVRGSK
jgi:hypothetical protein